MNLAPRSSSHETVDGRLPAFSRSIDDVLATSGTDPTQGLTNEEANHLRERYGATRLQEAPATPVWIKLLGQFKDLVIWILIVAALISGVLGEWVDAIAILSIVLLNGMIGFAQEERAGRALAALQKLSAPGAKVLREGVFRSLPASELVPGDVIDMEAGDNIPADARLIEAYSVMVQEAALTGESVPVEKDAGLVLPKATPLGERWNMVYMGTIAASGKGRAVIVATGMTTELGQIAGMLERHEPELTPLQRRLAELGRVLIAICLAIVLTIFGLQVARGGDTVEAFMVSVSLAVAAVPEGLPAVVTIALALGLQRMVRRNALVRRLPSVETLGSVSVICSDKTGTLTRNEMTVRQVMAGGALYDVTGTGYVPQGQFYHASAGVPAAPADVSPESDLHLALTIGAMCNNAQLIPLGDGAWDIIGDPTEGALIVAALKAGIDVAGGRKAIEYEIPFDSARRQMSVAVRQDHRTVLYSKGAPEVILERSLDERVAGEIRPLTDDRRREILAANECMAGQALRVLALAFRRDVADRSDGPQENDLVFAGLVGMIDPPREEAKEAVEKCRDAGIRPVMITGDHPITALAIAKDLNMVSSGDRALPGAELDGMTDDELAAQVDRMPVFARASAEHKLRIVRAWQSRGQVVAMTGDGVNDAPAIKVADIGIAMGITGTDVTKEASDMVLTDDNFASIVSAVEEGRGIFDNIRKVLQFLLSCNFGEILLMLVAGLAGWPSPLLPIQLLWINLVTDGLPALALSLEPPEPGVMRRKPRRSDESLLSLGLGLSIVWQGALVGLVGVTAFAYGYLQHGDVERARAMTFCVVVYAELLRALASRSQTMTLGQLGLLSNPHVVLAIVVSGMLQISVAVIPFAQYVFDVPTHTVTEWAVVAVLALAPVTLIECGKLVYQWWMPRTPGRAMPHRS